MITVVKPIISYRQGKGYGNFKRRNKNACLRDMLELGCILSPFELVQKTHFLNGFVNVCMKLSPNLSTDTIIDIGVQSCHGCDKFNNNCQTAQVMQFSGRNQLNLKI